MKLFNNFSDENQEKGSSPRPIDPPRREFSVRPTGLLLRDEPPPIGDPLRFDTIDDEFEDRDEFLPDEHEGEEDYENVDVQAILFYGHTGRRCFPTVKAL